MLERPPLLLRHDEVERRLVLTRRRVVPQPCLPPLFLVLRLCAHYTLSLTGSLGELRGLCQ